MTISIDFMFIAILLLVILVQAEIALRHHLIDAVDLLVAGSMRTERYTHDSKKCKRALKKLSNYRLLVLKRFIRRIDERDEMRRKRSKYNNYYWDGMMHLLHNIQACSTDYLFAIREEDLAE